MDVHKHARAGAKHQLFTVCAKGVGKKVGIEGVMGTSQLSEFDFAQHATLHLTLHVI